MTKNFLLNVSRFVLCGAFFLTSSYASDEESGNQRKKSSSDSKGTCSIFEEGENALEAFLRPGFAKAVGYLSPFADATQKKDFAGAVAYYEKAIEVCPSFRWPFEMETGALYLKLESAATSSKEKETYLKKARSVCDSALLKNKEITLDDLRVLRDLALQEDDLEKLAAANKKIMTIIGAPKKISDVVPLLLQSFKEGNYESAHKMWKVLVKNRAIIPYIEASVAGTGLQLCALQKDYKGVSQALDFVSDKKAFFAQNDCYILYAYEACLALNQYEKLLEVMKCFSKNNNLKELELIACLSELQGDYQGALVARERILTISPENVSYEKVIGLCQRAANAARVPSQKKAYLKKIQDLKPALPETESVSGHKKSHAKPTLQDAGRILRSMIAKKHMESAADLWARMPQDEWPELRALQEEMGTHYKTCALSFDAIKEGKSSLTMSDMGMHVTKMEKILKAITVEKEKIYLARRLLREQTSPSDELPILFPTKPVNRRKEVLEALGLPQRRGKQEIIEEDAPAGNVVVVQDDTPYEITWQWTPKSQKQQETLVPEAQTKLDTFMAEVTQNPWSVRRDGSLALGEPRFVTGSPFGPNTYERDMDAHNRFIYNVTATGPKTARVMILGVQGHL